MKYENNICSTWLENQGENFINTRVNDVYYDYLRYCKNNKLPHVLRGVFKHILKDSKKYTSYYNKLKFSNEWEGIHE